MLHQISWLNYFALTLGLISLYYIALLLIYYIPQWLLAFKPAAAPVSFFTPEEEILSDDDENGIEEIDQLIAEIKDAAVVPPGDYAPLATLRQNLKAVLQNHRALQDSPHRPAINELVVSECEKHGRALLAEAEVDQWWGDQPLAPLPGPAPAPDGWPR